MWDWTSGRTDPATAVPEHGLWPGVLSATKETLMTDARCVPKEETRFAGNGGRAVEDAATSDLRDLEDGARTGQPGDTAFNVDEPGRFGDMKQNLTNQWKVRESSAVPRD